MVKKVQGRETISWESRSVGIRNEPLDTRVYATGALELYNPNLEMHRRRRGTKKMPTRPPEVRKNPVPPPPSAEKPETQASSQAATQPTTQTAPKTTPTRGRSLRRSVQVLRHGMRL